MPPQITWYKIGMELFTSEGPAALALLRERGKNVFLDLKFHDIPRTVARAIAAASRQGVSMLTVHAMGGREMLKAAADAAGESGPRGPRIIAVTTLTSLNDTNLREMGIARPVNEHTLLLGEMAMSSGIHGLVCSPLETAAFREKLGQDPILVTPGIRPSGADAGDQKRIATPYAAIKSGADFLVVGRPILDAPDIHHAAVDILGQMKTAP